ncbi:hypothetical protein RAZWK3B_11737 [Roseobacter sp. AzwK-3b]|nr:hypothetical protein RAZWK3B_11737 [Roseobacter sp. AzwK-3b]
MLLAYYANAAGLSITPEITAFELVFCAS